MPRQQFGHAALTGWRHKVATGVSRPVARRSPVSESTVEHVLGLLFFVLSVVYVVRTVARWSGQARRTG
jgi:hypothetical protein